MGTFGFKLPGPGEIRGQRALLEKRKKPLKKRTLNKITVQKHIYSLLKWKSQVQHQGWDCTIRESRRTDLEV